MSKANCKNIGLFKHKLSPDNSAFNALGKY